MFDSQGRLCLHNCWAVSPVTDIHRYVARIFSCPMTNVFYCLQFLWFFRNSPVHIYDINICSLIQYVYVICMYDSRLYMHLYVTCKFFSEDETTVKSNLAAGRKPKIRGSDREWERLAGHESWSNSATLQHACVSPGAFWMFQATNGPWGEKWCTNDNFEVIIYIYIVIYIFIYMYISVTSSFQVWYSAMKLTGHLS